MDMERYLRIGHANNPKVLVDGLRLLSGFIAGQAKDAH